MVFDHGNKRKIGILCFLPVVCFTTCVLYYLTLILPLLDGHPEVNSIVGITRAHYDSLFYMLAVSALITSPVFIYCLVLLARFKHLNSAVKLMWIIFLCVIAPISSMFFWLFLIKDAPKYVGAHHDIA